MLSILGILSILYQFNPITRMICRDHANLFVRFCRDQYAEPVPAREDLLRGQLSSLVSLISDTPLSMRSSKPNPNPNPAR